VSTAIWPFSVSTWFCATSSAAWAMNFCWKSSRWRARLRSDVARSALSFSTWAWAFRRLASSARESSEKRSSPFVTFWPSRMWTCEIVLVTWERRSTVCSAVTTPFALILTGTIARLDFRGGDSDRGGGAARGLRFLALGVVGPPPGAGGGDEDEDRRGPGPFAALSGYRNSVRFCGVASVNDTALGRNKRCQRDSRAGAV
jgi:hypothetical protein